ncbi:MAG TPA: DUF4157 domain-containing protein [Thermoanaerobaculia bacterium]|nr:DUF4157 domain-containing protein [Thermoanaerobaculia bacterium]
MSVALKSGKIHEPQKAPTSSASPAHHPDSPSPEPAASAAAHPSRSYGAPPSALPRHANGLQPASSRLRSLQRSRGNAYVASREAERDASPGQKLPAEVLREQGERFGASFEGVRVHADARAAELASGLRAKAFTRGSDVYFGQGRFAPGTVEGKRLVAHELTHVVQNARGAAAAGTGAAPREDLEREARQAGEGASSGRPVEVSRCASHRTPLLRDDGESGTAVLTPSNVGQIVLPFYHGTNPLAPYTVLRQESPESWSALARTARVRTLAVRLEGEPEETPPAMETIEVRVPVRNLVRPRIPSLIAADLRTRLWPVVSDEFGNPDEAADILRDEIVSRWAAQNQDLLDSEVRIRLLAPEETAPPPMAMTPEGLLIGQQQVLAFDIDGEPVESTDGSLALLELDLLGTNNVEEVGTQVAEEAITIATAGDLLRASGKIVDLETDFWSRVRNDPDSVSRNEVEQHYGLFSIRLNEEGPAEAPLGLKLAFFLQDHPEYASEFDEVAPRLAELTGWVHEDYRSYLDYFEATSESFELYTMREGLDYNWEAAEEQWDEGSVFTGGLAYGMTGIGEAFYFVANGVTFGYPDTRHAGVQAFKRGEISYDELDELSDAAAARGAAVGLVGLALTVATAGLAGPVLGVGATLGRQALFYGAAGFATNVVTETTGHTITALSGFEDPTQQAIWDQGRRTPGQILASGALGFGLGAGGVAAGAALGKLALWLRRSPVKPPAPGAAIVPAGEVLPSPGVTAPPGWTMEQIGDDLFRLTRPDVPGEVIVSPTSMRYQTPAGTGMRVEVEVPLGGQGRTANIGGVEVQLPGSAVLPELPAGAAHPALPVPETVPAVPAVQPTPALPAPAATPSASNLVWVNPRSGVFHPPGSRWYGKTPGGMYMTETQALAAGHRAAGQLPPSGVYAVERPAQGAQRIVIRSRLGPSQARRGYERQMASAAEYGVQEIAGWERAHSQGAGFGAEAAEAIRLAPRQVNQALQNRGIERTIRDLYRTKPPDVELHLTTVTQTHPGTLRLQQIDYVLEAWRGGQKVGTVLEASIEVGRSGRATIDVESYGTIFEALNRAPAGHVSAASLPPRSVESARVDRSPGQPLAPDLRMDLGARLGFGLNAVRIHTDTHAARLAADLDARAFTRGEHVYFGTDEFDPASTAGRRLLGHELAHVAQQRNGADHHASAFAGVQPEDSPLEREAEATGARFASLLSPAPFGIQRFEGQATAEGLIDKYTSWGNLDEEGLGQKLFDLAWMSPDHYGFVISVIDELAGHNRDDVALVFGLASRDDNLDEFAATETGRKMLIRLQDALMGGPTFPQEGQQVARFRAALARREGAEKGRERGAAVLDTAASKAVTPAAPGEVKVLSIAEIQTRMRLVDALLKRLALRYANDPATSPAVNAAQGSLALARTSLGVTNAAELSRRVPEVQMILERTEGVLLNLDLQIVSYRAKEELGVTREPLIELTGKVRGEYVKALALVMRDAAVPAFNRAEAMAAQLPRALAEVELARLEAQPSTYTILDGSRKEIREWVGQLRTQLNTLQSEAEALRRARESNAPDVAEREARFTHQCQVIELSIEAIEHWAQALRAWEYLAGGGNILLGAYKEVHRILERCQRMHEAASADDLALLRERVEAHRKDPSVESFYRELPEIVRNSRFVVSLAIVLAAAVVTAGVGGVVGGALGTATTFTGRVLVFASTSAVEALTFTSVSRGLQDIAPGPGPHGSFLADLAWNFGLFGLLRGVSGGIRTSLAARGLEILETPVAGVASLGILQGYGMLRFRIEEGRWPSSDELARMTAENLIMFLGIAVATRGVHRALEAHKAHKNLQTFHSRYAWRFELLEGSRQKLLGDFRTALEKGQAADPAAVENLKETGKTIDEAYRALVEEIKADRSISLEAAREELKSLGLEPMEGSEELLTRSLGLPEEVRLRRAGGLDQYTYEWGGTGRVEERLRALGATVDKAADPTSGLRTISVSFPDRTTMTFVERPAPFPATAEVDVDPTHPALTRLVADFAIANPAAQRFVVRLLGTELAKNPAHGVESAAKPVRKLLRRLEAAAKTKGGTTEAELLDLRAKGVIAAEAKPLHVATADHLASRGILRSPEWLSARTPQEFESAVSEWLGYEETAAATPAGRTVLRRVRILGDLFEDAALTQPRLEAGTGKPRTGVDVVPELDLLSVSEKAGVYELHSLGNIKGFAGGATDAANQNRLSLDALRAHQSGTAAEITTREGTRLFAKVTQVTGYDPLMRTEVSLTGKLREAAGGAATETIGPKQTKSPYDRQLSATPGDLSAIAKILREQQAMKSPEY